MILIKIGFAFIGVMFLVILITALTSCTISLQNVSTAGEADDVVDQTQQASPDVKTDLQIPVKAI